MADGGFSPAEDWKFCADWIAHAMKHGYDAAMKVAPGVQETKDSVVPFGPAIVEHKLGKSQGELAYDKAYQFFYIQEVIFNSAGVAVTTSTILIPRENVLRITPVEEHQLSRQVVQQAAPQQRAPLPTNFVGGQQPVQQQQVYRQPAPPPIQEAPIYAEVPSFDIDRGGFIMERVQINAPPERIEGSLAPNHSWSPNPSILGPDGRPVYENQNLDRNPDEGAFQ
jgi:hypothetical protein